MGTIKKSFLILAMVLQALAMSFPTQHAFADTEWDGSESSDWTDPDNWSDGVPDGPAGTNGAIIINDISVNTPSLSTNSTAGGGAGGFADVNIGTGGNTGALNHSAGTLSTGSGSWARVGVDSGTGTYNLSGTASFSVSDRLYVGDLNGTGTINMADSSSVSAANLYIGAAGGDGTVNVNTSGSLNVGYIEIASGGTSTGVLDLDSGTVNNSGITSVGHGGGDTDTQDGTFNMSGGTYNSGGVFRVGFAGAAGATATATISGGTLNVGTGGETDLEIARHDFLSATLNVTGNGLSGGSYVGGVVNLQNGSDIEPGNGNNNSGDRLINVDGGQIIGTAGSLIDFGWPGGTNTLDIKNGGVVAVQAIFGGGNADKTVNFDNGTLRAVADDGGFINFFGSGTEQVNILSGGATIDTNGFNVTVFEGLLDGSGGGGLTKVNTGTLTLSAASTYTGGTAINAGVVSIGELTGPSANEGTNTSLGTGDVTVASGAQLVLAGNNLTIANNVTVNAGNPTINGLTGALVGGRQDGVSANEITGTVTLGGSGDVGVSTWWSDKTLELSGQVTGTGNLRVVNANGGSNEGSIVILSNSSNDYSGDTIVDSGGINGTTQILRLGSDNVLPNGAGKGNVTVNGTLDVNGQTDTINGLSGSGSVTLGAGSLTVGDNNATSTFGGVVSGSGSLTKGGTGTHTLAGTNTYTGGTTVNEGTLSLATGGGSGAIRGTLTINSGADVQLNATDALGFNGGGVSVETINVNGGTLNNNVAGNNGLRASLNLTGGTVTSSGGGTFQIDPGLGASISSNASAAQSTVSSNIEIRGPSTSLAIGVADGAATTDLEISGAMSNSTFDGGSANGITKSGSGTLVLSGNNTYTGPTVVENGILSLSASGSINSTESISIDAGATLNVGSGYSFAGFDGSITGNGDVTGDLTLPSGATIAPGDSIGTLTFSAALEILGALTLEVDASTADRLLVGGQLTIGSGAMLTFIEEATPTAPVIQLATYDTLVGTFDPGNITAQPANYDIDYTYDFGGGVMGIALVAVPEASSFLAMGLVTGIFTCRLSRRRRRAEQAA